MKKKIATALLTLLSAAAFAQDETTFSVGTPAPIVEKQPEKKSFKYVRMGVSPVSEVGAIPSLGIGYRRASGHSAVDISTSGSGHSSKGIEAYTYTLPKANYLYYLTPAVDNSLYMGGGLAWGGVKKSVKSTDEDGHKFYKESSFHGIVANAAVGYEMYRSSPLRSFVQLDVNQPIVATHGTRGFPSPSTELAAGIGF
jgi:hypothetical protein